jgi:hypothetical protein
VHGQQPEKGGRHLRAAPTQGVKSKLRTEQYYSRHPQVERSEQRRLAQQRYRKAHAEELRTARQIGQVLMRRAT